HQQERRLPHAVQYTGTAAAVPPSVRIVAPFRETAPTSSNKLRLHIDHRRGGPTSALDALSQSILARARARNRSRRSARSNPEIGPPGPPGSEGEGPHLPQRQPTVARPGARTRATTREISPDAGRACWWSSPDRGPAPSLVVAGKARVDPIPACQVKVAERAAK